MKFEAELRLVGTTATAITIPFDPREVLGAATPPVRGTINGYPFRSKLGKRGGEHYLVVNREVRAGAGASVGDTVVVELERDDEPRVVELPDELAAALDAEARATWERLSYSHRKEYVDWIREAKREETRQRRIAKAVELLREGKTQR